VDGNRREIGLSGPEDLTICIFGKMRQAGKASYKPLSDPHLQIAILDRMNLVE